MTRHALVVRLDSMGDVLVCGPAIRAVAQACDRVTVLAGPRGAAAAALLPGVDDVVVWDCPWIAAPPAPPVDEADVTGLVSRLRGLDIDEALVLTSFHQSALPTALVLRLAGVPRVAAVSDDYPGSLLDVRIPSPGDAPEAVRMRRVAEAGGYALPAGDDGLLRVCDGPVSALPRPYVVLHPGTDAPARSYPLTHWTELARLLCAAGRTVVLTGAQDEAGECAAVAHGCNGPVVDLAGKTDLAGLAAVLRGADAVVVANTGPAHLAAAVGVPVVSLFAPVVPASRWAPHGRDVVVLGDQDAACRGTRARTCPVPGHPCLSGVSPAEVMAALDALVGRALAGAPA